MRSIRSPLIFVDRQGEIAVFKSPEHAEASLTAIEVLANGYRGFSGTGVRLILSPQGVTNWRVGWISVDASAEQADRELRELLIDFGVRHGAKRERLEELNLHALVASLQP